MDGEGSFQFGVFGLQAGEALVVGLVFVIRGGELAAQAVQHDLMIVRQ
jgi:hypothetical protein